MEKKEELRRVLQARFEENMGRHEGLAWTDVQAKLEANPQKWEALAQMEATGGEPDVIGYDGELGEYLFCDCAPESPAGRRSLCYDHAALEGRKENKPQESAVHMAETMGVELLTEAAYRRLQECGSFDAKTSSWVATPDDIRALGGALFCDRRYGHVFTYHNGAESYYGGRGFRALLRV
jgi:hypothetical protein